MIMILALFACRSGEEAVAIQQKEPLLHYSKGPCLGRCPVYDFWVYPDGNFVYKRARGTKSNREIKGRLTSEEMEKLKKYLHNNLIEPVVFNRIRDLPVSTLRFNGKKYEYHANKIKAGLKEVNTLIESIVTIVISRE
ncbi:DUF6438 domain-containing protein [Flagellimonas sp. 2504JD1-5]